MEGISWAPLPGMSLQALVQETEAQSKKLAGMEAGAACLTQDNGGPPSLVGSVKEQLASVLQQVSRRGEVLEEAHQQAKQVSHTRPPQRAAEDRGLGGQACPGRFSAVLLWPSSSESPGSCSSSGWMGLRQPVQPLQMPPQRSKRTSRPF